MLSQISYIKKDNGLLWDLTQSIQLATSLFLVPHFMALQQPQKASPLLPTVLKLMAFPVSINHGSIQHRLAINMEIYTNKTTNILGFGEYR